MDLDIKVTHKLQIFKKKVDDNETVWVTVDEDKTGFSKRSDDGISSLVHTIDAALISKGYDMPTQAVGVSIFSNPNIKKEEKYAEIVVGKEDGVCYALNLNKHIEGTGHTFGEAVRNVIR